VLWAGAGFHAASALAQIYALTFDQAGNAVAVDIDVISGIVCGSSLPRIVTVSPSD
jgi:hypothetical protein